MRSKLVLCLAAVLLAAAAGVSAQAPVHVFKVGLFHVGLDHDPPALAPLRENLRRLGYEDGKNIHLDYRNQANEDAAHATARAFRQERVDLIIAFENQAVRAAKAATSEIPIVFAHVSDPVAAGWVKSMARPGTNLTGVADFIGELHDKRLQIFTEILPRLRRLLILVDPTDPTRARATAEITRAAQQLKIQLVERRATTEAEVTKAFAALKKGDVDAALVVSPNLTSKFPGLILRLSLEHQLPIGFHRKALAEQGALFAYGTDFRAVAEDVAGYVDRVLKGAKPADLPVQQAARLELTLNNRIARALGIAIPQAVVLRANSVIE